MYDVNEALVELDALCMSFSLTANDHRHCYDEKGPKWELVVYWDNPVGGDEYEGKAGESVGDLVLRALRDPDRLVYESVRKREEERYGPAKSDPSGRQLTLPSIGYIAIDTVVGSMADYDAWDRTHGDTEAFPGSDY